MRALVFHQPFEVAAETVEDPGLEASTDVIVQIEVAAICGSDLHPFTGREPGLEAGTVMGHEFLGRVVARGAEAGIDVGSRVVAPFSTSCGECFFCARGLTARCESGQLFGWREEGRGLHGGQAEFVRVPMADSTLVALPGADEAAAGTETAAECLLLAGDVLATGLFAADAAGVRLGTRAAVVGCGPVGLAAILAAFERGAEKVFALDPVASRRKLAESFGATALAPDEGGARLREATSGRGADAVLELVGSPEASRLAFDLVRSGGAIAAAGVHTEAGFAFSPGELYDKNLTYRAGRCSARAYLEEALELAARRGRQLAAMLTHRIGLEEAPAMYERFARREAGCVKVLIRPDRGSRSSGSRP